MKCKGGQAPPSGTPPLPGPFGAPPAHRFGSRGVAWTSREDAITHSGRAPVDGIISFTTSGEER
jgi:hypothetical protein